MPHSMGVPVASDFADRPSNDPVFGLYKRCGLWTMDEAAILFTVAEAVGGSWLDLGCHTGWTSAHIAAADCQVTAVDNMLPVPEFYARFRENVKQWNIETFAGTTAEFFAADRTPKMAVYPEVPEPMRFSGVVIDADHEHPWPLYDARNAMKHLEDRGAVLFHDFIGRPVRIAVEYLISGGFHCRIFWTPHMVACCWRGNIDIPEYVPQANIDWQHVKNTMRDFDFTKCE
jgi:SAM-dependent methyltransferase